MLVKAVGWLVVGYLFGIIGFALVEFFETFGEMDLVSALVHSLVEGIKWPASVVDLFTGKHGNRPSPNLL